MYSENVCHDTSTRTTWCTVRIAQLVLWPLADNTGGFTILIAGPLLPGLDPTSKGTMGKNLRYLLAAKYMAPKTFVEAMAGREPPDDHGMEMLGKDIAKETLVPDSGEEVTKLQDVEFETVEEFFRGKSEGEGEPGDAPVVEVVTVPEDNGDGLLEQSEEELDDEPPEPLVEEEAGDEEEDLSSKGQHAHC